MKPLVVIDLEGPFDAALGQEVTASLHRGIAPDRPLVVVGPHDRLPDGAAIAVTGSPAMVHDVAWARPLGGRIMAAAGRGVPVLGICFAHQLLAVAAGGSIASWDEVRTGVKDVPVGAAADGPFAPVAGRTARLVHTHRDRVVDAGAFRPIDPGMMMLAHPRLPVWTMQGHPEATPAACRAWAGGLEALDARALAATDGPALLAAFGQCAQD